jgi:hypothetical protein
MRGGCDQLSPSGAHGRSRRVESGSFGVLAEATLVGAALSRSRRLLVRADEALRRRRSFYRIIALSMYLTHSDWT